MRLKIRSERGDTIVEVLLAIAITAAVLAGAYVATNRSLKASQSARERSEAIKIAETQIERLKYLNVNPPAPGPGAANIYQNGPFCITSTLTTPAYNDTDTTPAGIIVAAEPAGCSFSPRYYVLITRNSASNVYQIQVVWINTTGVNGSVAEGFEGTDQIKMYYRIFQ